VFESISLAFGMIWRGATFLSLSAGVLIGTIFGALPGLTTTMAMALFVPLTFFMEPLIGIPFLLGLYKGGMFGGSVSAILISTPGTAAAAATVLDGYPLSQQGKAGKALNMALYSSVIGETFGNFVLLLLAGFLATAALAFGPPEYTAILIFSFTVISGLSGDSLLKGLIAAAFGFFLSTIGIDPQYGTSRLTFGIRYLDGGLSVVPVLIGLFAISEILSLAVKRKSADKVKTVLKGKENRFKLA
jgi:putative tricarboxylic transport membrane protein